MYIVIMLLCIFRSRGCSSCCNGQHGPSFSESLFSFYVTTVPRYPLQITYAYVTILPHARVHFRDRDLCVSHATARKRLVGRRLLYVFLLFRRTARNASFLRLVAAYPSFPTYNDLTVPCGQRKLLEKKPGITNSSRIRNSLYRITYLELNFRAFEEHIRCYLFLR